MATKLTLSSPLPFKTSFLPKSPLLSPPSYSPTANVLAVKVHAKLGNSPPFLSVLSHPVSHSVELNESLYDTLLGGGDDEQVKKGGKRKFITRDEEPQQYWQTAGEREGENPMKTPLPYIIIFGMSTPFVILAIAFANGWIKVPVR
ncbi:uncharacterized protein LOC113847216 isoform X1 [Abrus precatorius]|uniref:Uncharacterized protein LOC113847216 isoform X1 n=1 Tax=Abrus precatorius TaxID=3816 RepID=A0A8B8JKI3_ABRPR|nr:uncharacterized protein LOC113847216 isoform X1 [Abrus precatorius]